MQARLDTLPERARPFDSPALNPRAAQLLALLGLRARADDPRVLALRAATLQTDALGDALAHWLHSAGPAGRRCFELALEHGSGVPSAPPALVALLQQVERTPVWLDRSLLRVGSEAMLRQGPEGLCALSAVSLMGGYLSSCATKPLAATGALAERAPRRLAETTQFVHAIMTSGSFERGSEAFKTTLRVRLMHAQVRARLAASPSWQREHWGVPINQRDMVATHLSFTVAFILGVRALGRIVTRSECDAIMHLWRYVSFLLGTPDELVPKTFREGLEVGAIFNATEPGPDADSRALAQALMHAWGHDATALEAPLARRLFGAFMVGYSRFVLGGQAADRLGLPDTLWKFAPPLYASARLLGELVRVTAPGGTGRALARGKLVVVRHLARTLGPEPARYTEHEPAHAHPAPA
jgi:ER-bound oxygenase mpaB/B'/Rubber oxygenase, catalytic domain